MKISASKDVNTHLDYVGNLKELISFEETANLMMWMSGGLKIVMLLREFLPNVS